MDARDESVVEMANTVSSQEEDSTIVFHCPQENYEIVSSAGQRVPMTRIYISSSDEGGKKRNQNSSGETKRQDEGSTD